jgi:inosine-uridine nucleoside N-ribohydrolase
VGYQDLRNLEIAREMPMHVLRAACRVAGNYVHVRNGITGILTFSNKYIKLLFRSFVPHTSEVLYMSPKKILLITDPTRDVDDVELFAVLVALQRLGLVEVVGVVVTYMVPELRARVMRLLCKLFGLNHQMVGMGSEFPLGKEGEQELLRAYLEAHSLYGVHYEGLGLDGLDRFGFAIFRRPEEVILNAIEDHQGELYLYVVAAATDVAKALLYNSGVFRRGGIKGGFFQAHATWDDRLGLVPDPIAFNVKADLWGAQIMLEQTQDLFPWTMVGKYVAYSMPVYEHDFVALRESGHPVGTYLY